ncbi:MAG: heavy metal translocating P-type ATPase [Lachnospiraceae bacterium]|nr:heavy metal translocating P-type ATPase [Candidatus Colinaster scatohippi]
MDKYQVMGMSCAACSTRVEKAVLQVDGVTSCSVNLLTNSMGVEGTASSDAVIKAVVDAGYGARLVDEKKNSGKSTAKYEDELKDTETPVLYKRLVTSVCVLIPLMYVSMGNMLWGWPLPAFLGNNHLGIGIYEMLLTIIIMMVNQKFFISGIKGVIHKSPNMDTLVALGAGAAFSYSVVALFGMTYAVSVGEHEKAMAYMNELYFESAATILTLITFGKTLEARAKGKTTDALKGLMRLAPKTAVVLRGKEEVQISVEDIVVGDHFVVRPGETIPVDGVVVEGISAINESALTGESIPVDKKCGDIVSAATINQSGYLTCEATRVGEDTTLSQIIQMVSDAAATKAPIAKIADRISGIFVPTVMTIAMLTFIVWLLAGREFGFALARAISVLVISCPCALGLATPVAIMVGNGRSAKNGLLFKTAVSLEEAGRVQIVALDKTGTITKGEPKVCQIIAEENVTEGELLEYAYALESRSEHPLAKAIVAKAKADGLSAMSVENFKAEVGNGLRAEIILSTDNSGRALLIGGNMEFVSGQAAISKGMMDKANNEAKKGRTPLFFAMDNKLLGIISVADVIKEDSAKAIENLKKLGVHVVMLTGDNEQTAKAIGDEAGVDEVIAEVLPEGKKEVIEALQKKGKVAMVGDGINDAPALTTADIGVAIGAGTDVAIDAADIVLMGSNLTDVAAAIHMSRGTLTNIRENLFWAFFYNVIGIPLAAGLWIPIFGWTLNPMFGAAAMGLSSFCVVSNALRLNLFDMYNVKKYKSVKNSLGHEPLLQDFVNTKKEEKNKMILNVNGMMCGHCEAHVKKALEAIDGVVEAVANHETNTVEIKTDRDVDVAVLKNAITEAGYEVV